MSGSEHTENEHMDMTKIAINTEAEAYPVLAISEHTTGRPGFEVPTALIDKLSEAQEAVEQAELEIMRYVAERYNHEDVHEWLTGRE